MPTVKLDLGRFVTLRRRADGTCRVLFEVPQRLRPSGWPATIPLPRKGVRSGDLTDADEVRRISVEARELYAEVQRQRRGVQREAQRSLRALVRAWQGSDEWSVLRPTSRKHYEAYTRNVLAWSEAAGHPDPTHITVADVKAFLALFNDRPATKKHTLKTLRIIMQHAVEAGWRADNPCRDLRVKTPVSHALIWERADVDAYVAEAEALRRPSIALMILLQWEIGQRMTDVRAFRLGGEYRGGVFHFAQSKTGAEVTIEVSPKLRRLLDAAGDGQLFIFRDESTNKAYTAERLVRVFEAVRDQVVARCGRPLQMRWLRHSCVVQLARAEATLPEIAAVTGHTLASVANILTTYLPRDNEVARNAQVKRGIVNKRTTTSLTPV